MTYLFLDDIRTPTEVFNYTRYPIYKDQTWVIVRNYKQFIKHILNQEFPYFISFDHDLGKGKSGYDCVKWLIEYCIDNNLKFPNYYCHSMNPVGKENINKLIENYETNANLMLFD